MKNVIITSNKKGVNLYDTYTVPYTEWEQLVKAYRATQSPDAIYSAETCVAKSLIGSFNYHNFSISYNSVSS